jgi:carbamoyl-phosphate synthase small subunit
MSGLLVAADGATFRGTSIGADGITTGEVVFNTSMTGYQEILTDPSYAGQVVVLTTSHVGNYGVSDVDAQAARPHVSGLIVRSLSRRHSNPRADGSLAAYLRENGIVAMSDIDTRRLTRHIRDRGAQTVAIGSSAIESELRDAVAATPSIEGRDLASLVTTPERYVVAAEGTRRGRVVAIDLGMKRDIVENLTLRGFDVDVVPATTPAGEILASDPDGVFVSNGPGDPAPLERTIATIRGLLGELPVFGICLGHQVLGLALGADTFKLPFGHHGGNHPVRALDDGRVQITAHNHGFAVDLWSITDRTAPRRSGLVTPDMLPGEVTTRFGRVIPTHQNLNDGTLEGLACLDVPAFGVQYHPEAAPGPHDATGLFDRFCDLMGVC